MSTLNGPEPSLRQVGDVPFHIDGATASVTGDRTAGTEIAIAIDGDEVTVADSVRPLVLSGDRDLSPTGLSHLLHHGHVPLPMTVFEGVTTLGMGDEARIRRRTSGEIDVTVEHRYPYLEAASRGDSEPDASRLLDLLVQSTVRTMEGAGDAVLMLSSGKDSTALAIAIAHAGLAGRVRCITYSNGTDDPEPAVARATAERLGLRHEVVELPGDPRTVERLLGAFFAGSYRPSADLAQIPYAFAVARASEFGEVLLDGGGNDSYMGFLPSKADLIKQRGRIRGVLPAAIVTRLVDVGSPFNYLARSRAEATLPGRSLRPVDTGRFYLDSVDTRPYWRAVSRRTANLSLPDLLNAVMVRHTDPQASMLKLRQSASAFGMTPQMPFCDDALADFFFHLPRAHRYDVSTGKTKLLLREMLSAYGGYDAEAIGKHPFRFGGVAFLERHRRFVTDEILSCPLWDRAAVSRTVDRWFATMSRRRPFTYHALLILFQVSGWINRSGASPHRRTG